MNNELLVTLAKKYGTPLYVYDSLQLISNIESIRKGIGTKPKLFYSVKANPNRHLLKLISKYVDGMEVCSIGEFIAAQEAGVDPERMIYVGPGKREKELKIVIEQNIGCIIVESIQELECINKLAEKKKVRVALRINPKVPVIGERLNMAGASTQFGMDEESIFHILRNKEYENITVEGVHFYFGTQQLDGIILNQQFMYAIAIFKKIIEMVPIKFVDFGGGFGVPYYENEKTFDFELLREWREVIHSSLFDRYEVFIESGRYIMANCGYFLTTVLYTKQINNKKYAIVDGGLNNHFSLACIGRLLKREFPVTVINDSREAEKVSIVGPLCTPVDSIATNVELPIIKPQDIIVIKNSGAYGYTYSPQLFLSHPTPMELLINSKNKVQVIRKEMVTFKYADCFEDESCIEERIIKHK